MRSIIKQGLQYKVKNNTKYFNKGDIVIALDNSPVPLCVLKELYDPSKDIYDYAFNVHSILGFELEEMEEKKDEEM